MTDLFLKLLTMSIWAGWIVLAVLLLRCFFRKAPKWITVLLWGIVAVRLICPFSIESAVSLMPEKIGNGAVIENWADDYVGEISIFHENSSEYETAVKAGREPVFTEEEGSYVVVKGEKLEEPSTIKTTVLPILTNIWIMGIAIMLIYTAVTSIQLHRKIYTAVSYCDNIFQSEYITSPFVLGVITPKIYLPFSISEEEISYVVAHEQAHISRKDHWWKPLGFLLLTIYWFHPLLWIAYILFCKDIELACDEKVIRNLNSEKRADYSQALLNCSVQSRKIAACPVAFGEVRVKERVKAVMNYKKTGFGVVVLALVLCGIAAACFLTNPKKETAGKYSDNDLTQYQTDYIGDASKVSAIAQNLPYPEGFSYDSIELQTTEEPYELIIFLKKGENAEVEEDTFEECADLAFDLIGNLGIFTLKDADTGEILTVFEQKKEDTVAADAETDLIDARKDDRILKDDETAKDTIEHVSEVNKKTDLESAVSAAIMENYDPDTLDGLLRVESHVMLSNEMMTGAGQNDIKEETVYLLVLLRKYEMYEKEILVSSECCIPTAITFSVSESEGYVVKEYWTPRDGSYYVEDIRAKFPGSAAEDALHEERYISELQSDSYQKALKGFYIRGTLKERIEELIAEIISSPKGSSEPAKYIEAHQEAYKELLEYEEYSLRYCFTEFLQGDQTDLRGKIMEQLCIDIMGNWGIGHHDVAYTTGQDWFDAFRESTENLAEQYGEEELEKNYPASWILWKLMQASVR